jgi:hypothetical protein
VVSLQHFADTLPYLDKASSFDSTSGNRLVLCFFACAQLPLTLCHRSRSSTCPPRSGQRAIMRVSDSCISKVACRPAIALRASKLKKVNGNSSNSTGTIRKIPA